MHCIMDHDFSYVICYHSFAPAVLGLAPTTLYSQHCQPDCSHGAGFRNTMKKMVGITVENDDPDMYNDAAKLPNPNPVAG